MRVFRNAAHELSLAELDALKNHLPETTAELDALLLAILDRASKGTI